MAALTGSLDTLREALACLKQDDQDQPAEGALLVPCGDLIRAANAAEVIQAARCPVCQHKVTDYITPELLDVAARVAFCAQGAAASSSTRVNYLNEHGLAPIHEAVIRGDMTRLKDLLGTPGIDLDVRSSDKKTALVHALTNRQVPLEAARELIHAGAAVTEMTLRGTTVLTLVFLNDAEELWEPVVARLREHPKTLREDVEQALQKIGSQYDSTGTSVSPSQLEMTRKLVALYLETGEPDEDVLTHALAEAAYPCTGEKSEKAQLSLFTAMLQALEEKGALPSMEKALLSIISEDELRTVKGIAFIRRSHEIREAQEFQHQSNMMRGMMGRTVSDEMKLCEPLRGMAKTLLFVIQKFPDAFTDAVRDAIKGSSYADLLIPVLNAGLSEEQKLPVPAAASSSSSSSSGETEIPW